MTDLMLKAADAETMMAKLTELGLADADGNPASKLEIPSDDPDTPSTYRTVRISFAEPFIWDTKPVYDEDGGLVSAGVISSDYHLNIRDLDKVIPDPSTQDWGSITWVDPETVSTPALVWS